MDESWIEEMKGAIARSSTRFTYNKSDARLGGSYVVGTKPGQPTVQIRLPDAIGGVDRVSNFR